MIKIEVTKKRFNNILFTLWSERLGEYCLSGTATNLDGYLNFSTKNNYIKYDIKENKIIDLHIENNYSNIKEGINEINCITSFIKKYLLQEKEQDND